MGEFLKVKHLVWTIGGMFAFAFGLGMNVNSKLTQVETNQTDIKKIQSDLKINSDLYKNNHLEIMDALHELELNLKLELKDKKNR